MPMRDNPKWEIIHGDSLNVLEQFPPGTFDAVITEIKTQNLIQSTAA